MRPWRGRWRVLAALASLVVALGAGYWLSRSRVQVTPEQPPRSTSASQPGVTTAPAAPTAPRASITLTDATAAAQVNFVHADGSSGRRYIIEAMSAGLALLDYDGDGDEDLFFLNGAPLPGAPATSPPSDALYRNDGNWTFVDVTDQAGVRDTAFGLGVAAGDYDNDGCLDLYISNYGPNVLYRNCGDGTFQAVTDVAGVACGQRTGAGPSFLDMDGDGDLDLYVANYVQFSPETQVSRTTPEGIPSYPGPLDFQPESDVLYRNDGDGAFTDVTTEAGINGEPSTGMGVTCFDYDNDGDTDVFVANDVMANQLYQNDGTGRFREMGVFSGVAYDAGGQLHANMGADAGDYDNDGWLDLHVTSYQRELATLYRNTGGLFEDVSRSTGAGEGTYNDVKWGNGLVDFDNDGHRDIYIACGHTEDNIEMRERGSSYPALNLLLANRGNGTFTNISANGGSGMAVKLASRGTAFGDLDTDGDTDVVVLNSRTSPTLLRNDSVNDHHWLVLRLRGVRANRAGIGCRVTVTAGNLRQIDEVHSGRGYQSSYGLQLLIGLGKHRRADRIEVRWLGGGTDVLHDVEADRPLTIVEGTAR